MNYTGRPSISGCRPVLSLYPTHHFCQYLLRIFITFTNSSLFCRAFSTNSRSALSVSLRSTRPPKAPPLGELSGASPTERARPLTANHRHRDSIALTKSLPITAQRLFPAGLALSVTFGDTSPKGRGLGRAQGAKNPPWRSQLLGGFLIAGDESAGFSHFCLYYMRFSAKVKHCA